MKLRLSQVPNWMWLATALLGFSLVAGTAAYWVATGSITGNTFTSGTADLTLDGQLADQGGSWQNSALAALDLIPGESIAADVEVKNVGDVALDLSATATASGTLATGTNGLTFEVFYGDTAGNSGSAASGDRSGNCGTGTSMFGPTQLSGSPTTVIASTDEISLATDDTVSVCVLVSLPINAATSLQGTTGGASFVFSGTQVAP